MSVTSVTQGVPRKFSLRYFDENQCMLSSLKQLTYYFLDQFLKDYFTVIYNRSKLHLSDFQTQILLLLYFINLIN